MVGITNVGGGGNVIAFINVTYPVGSSCSAAKDGKTILARDTSGSYVFLIQESGDWTITSTDGISTASKTVTVTPWTATSIELAYTSIPEDLRDTYYEVEYINFYGNGTASTDIDTLIRSGISITDQNSYFDIELTFTPEGLSSSTTVPYVIVGNEANDTSTNYVQGVLIKNGKFILCYGAPTNSTQYITGADVVSLEQYFIQVHLAPMNGTFELTINNAETITIANQYNLFLSMIDFGTKYYAPYGTAKGRYGKAKILKDSVLVADMIPCVRRSDSVCGYLNLIDRSFAVNVNNNGSSAGNATPGPSIGS